MWNGYWKGRWLKKNNFYTSPLPSPKRRGDFHFELTIHLYISQISIRFPQFYFAKACTSIRLKLQNLYSFKKTYLRCHYKILIFSTCMYQKIKQWAKTIKKDVLVVWLVAKDQRTPVWIKILALIVAAYALSPIDLIPDFIPVLGYLDDIIIVPLGLLLVIKLTPQEILDDCRIRASLLAERPVNRWAAGVIILIWLLFLGYLTMHFLNMQKL